VDGFWDEEDGAGDDETELTLLRPALGRDTLGPVASCLVLSLTMMDDQN